jgi:hypothetical protein
METTPDTFAEFLKQQRRSDGQPLTQEDLNRMFTSIARRQCARRALNFADWGPELIQIAWEITLRKWRDYEPRGQLYSSFAFEWARAYVNEFLIREGKRAGSHIELQDGDEFAYEREPLAVEIADINPLVLLQGAGYSDAEIAEHTGMTQNDVTRTRKAARRDLIAATA